VRDGNPEVLDEQQNDLKNNDRLYTQASGNALAFGMNTQNRIM
jgi:hypothetical protein